VFKCLINGEIPLIMIKMITFTNQLKNGYTYCKNRINMIKSRHKKEQPPHKVDALMVK